MLHNRQAPGRDFHKHFSLAPARSDTITASSTASATAATRNPPPHPDPYKTGPQARKATSRAPHLSLMSLSPPAPSNKASATEQPAQRTAKQALHNKQHSSRNSPPHTSNHEWAQTVKGGETPPACAPPLSGVRTAAPHTSSCQMPSAGGCTGETNEGTGNAVGC
jgi:hypothetical protein